MEDCLHHVNDMVNLCKCPMIYKGLNMSQPVESKIEHLHSVKLTASLPMYFIFQPLILRGKMLMSGKVHE